MGERKEFPLWDHERKGLVPLVTMSCLWSSSLSSCCSERIGCVSALPVRVLYRVAQEKDWGPGQEKIG